MTQTEAIIEASHALKGIRSIDEIRTWVGRKYGDRWVDFATAMADMVPLSHGGNQASNVPDERRVLERVSRGTYKLKYDV